MLGFNKLFPSFQYLNYKSRVVEEETKINENENAFLFTPYFFRNPAIFLQQC